MSEFDQDVNADSSTATQVADPSQATTQPANNGDPYANVPFHQHPRWQQVMRERATDRQAIDEMRRQNTELQERLGQFQPKPKSEEEMAREALHRLDPNIPKYGEQLAEVQGAVSEFRQERFASRGDSMITAFATQHGVDPKGLSDRIVEIIGNDPALLARAKAGDVTVVQHFLRAIEPVVDQLKRAGQQTQAQQTSDLARNKVQLRNQPPRPGTSPSGQPAPLQLERGKERSFWEDVQSRARGVIRSAAEG